MKIREAILSDIPQIQIVRNLVKENVLSDPSLVPDSDVADYITRRGKGWVCEIANEVVGFSIIDLQDHNVWALFMHPDFEKQGIGKQLHDVMMDWYFAQTQTTVWLGTEPKSRAENFYRKAGWQEVGVHGKGEVKFEMQFADWQNAKTHL
jgi:GNAT superfamily N-acetyltransferase